MMKQYTVKMPGFAGKQEILTFKNYIFFVNWFRKLNKENGNRYAWHWEDTHNNVIRVVTPRL